METQMQTQLLSPFGGMALLGGYAAMVSLVVWFFSRYHDAIASKQSFLVANRNLSLFPAALSIAATWIWAPALFVSAERAYTQGWVGLFWFLVPNVLCLILFAAFAQKIRNLFPEGFTLSGYMRERHSKRVQNLYLLALAGLATCSFAVQLLAGGKIVSAISGIPFFYTTVLLALIPIGYTLRAGIKGSVIGDFLQMLVIFGVGALVIPWAISEGGGFSAVLAGLGGKTGTFTDLFEGDGWTVFLTFGLPVTIGLLSGPFGDQSFWQRSFSIKKESVGKAFVLGAFLFGIVPLSIGLLGFLAAGMGFQAANPSQVNFEVVMSLLPGWVAIPFLFLLLSGLVSTLDSNLSSISSLAGHDVYERRNGKEEEWKDQARVMTYSRLAMVVLVLGGIAIANVPGITILYLFLFYGTLRASTMLPTVITLLKKNVSESGVFWGIATSIAVGLPMFAYGNLYKITPLIVAGSLTTLLASGIITLVASRKLKA
jgi:Na+/proline symporter